MTVAQRTHTMTDDAALVAAAKEDYAAFDILYRRYITRIYRYCYMQCGDTQDAEDLTAHTFLAALESIQHYQERNSFAAWLFTIARRRCHDYHRRHYRHPEASLETAAKKLSGSPDPERQAFKATIIDCVKRMLPQLTEDRQEVVRLRYWGGLSTAETAAVMGKGQSAVKMLLLRAVNHLRERCLNETVSQEE